MRATGVLAEMAEAKKKSPISSYAVALGLDPRDHAQTIGWSRMTILRQVIPPQCR
jgi:hypothetical protein